MNQLINQEDGTWRLVDDHHRKICEFRIRDNVYITLKHNTYKPLGRVMEITYKGGHLITLTIADSYFNRKGVPININDIKAMEIEED